MACHRGETASCAGGSGGPVNVNRFHDQTLPKVVCRAVHRAPTLRRARSSGRGPMVDSKAFRACHRRAGPYEPRRMLPKFLTQIFGSRNERLLKAYRRTVQQINALEPSLEQLDDAVLR
ncbi:MAG: hypothetical protein ACK56I_26280, partial [bacterium]